MRRSAPGSPSPLPELPIQYADYAVWQRQWLQGEVLEAQLAYWKRSWTGRLPCWSCPPTARGRRSRPSAAARHAFALSAALTAGAQAP